jgi:hypothetical protein
MNALRIAALAVLLAGVGLLAYGIWQYFDSRSEIRIGDASLVIDDSEFRPPVWIGAVLIIAGGVGVVVARRRKS